MTLVLYLDRGNCFFPVEHSHIFLFADEVEPRLVDVECVQSCPERSVIAGNLVEDEVHAVTLVMEIKRGGVIRR